MSFESAGFAGQSVGP